jgi:hypothetical protein
MHEPLLRGAPGGRCRRRNGGDAVFDRPVARTVDGDAGTAAETGQQTATARNLQSGRVSWMCRSRGPAGSRPPRFEFGSGRVGRERTISREESAATSAEHSPCLREINVPDGSRSLLPSPDTVLCQERVARHLAFCPTPAAATIRYGVPLVRTANSATLSTTEQRHLAAVAAEPDQEREPSQRNAHDEAPGCQARKAPTLLSSTRGWLGRREDCGRRLRPGFSARRREG